MSRPRYGYFCDGTVERVYSDPGGFRNASCRTLVSRGDFRGDSAAMRTYRRREGVRQQAGLTEPLPRVSKRGRLLLSA